MADGWRCPACSLVLAPHVAEHRCNPPASGVATVVGSPSSWGPTTITVPWQPNVAVTYPDTGTAHATTGHLSVAGGYLAAVPDTDAMPVRAITETAA